MTSKDQRILVIGAPGSGKTTWSKILSKKINTPVFHLDDYYWLNKWERVDPVQWQSILMALCEKPSWIIDGNHFGTFKDRLIHADLVIMLDCSVLVSFFSFCKRSLRRYFFTDEHLPINIKNDATYKPRASIEWHLIKLILLFKIQTKPKMIRMINQQQTRLCILPNRKAYKTMLEII